MTQQPGQFSKVKPSGEFQRNPLPTHLARENQANHRDIAVQRARRRQLVAQLRDEGRSLRQIAKALDISHEQARQDLTVIKSTPITRRRMPVLERVRLERGSQYFTDELGNLFHDPELHRPAGLAAVKSTSREVDD